MYTDLNQNFVGRKGETVTSEITISLDTTTTTSTTTITSTATADDLVNANVYLIVKKNISDDSESAILDKKIVSFGTDATSIVITNNEITTTYTLTNTDTNQFLNAATTSGYIEYEYKIFLKMSNGTVYLLTDTDTPPKFIIYPSLKITNFSEE